MLPPFSPELRSVAGILAPIAILFAGVLIAAIWPTVKHALTGRGRRPTPPEPIIWILTFLFIIVGTLSSVVINWPLPPPPAVSLAGDDGSFVYDEAVQDDTQFQPGQRFAKSWRLYNKGNTEWKNYEARRIFGTLGLSGFVVQDTLPKHDVVISEDITAPQTLGCYKSVYQLYNGHSFFGEKFDVQIAVVSPQIQSYALFVDDLNVRDGTLFSPGVTFWKGWALHNCGTNTWTNYIAKRTGGDLKGPSIIPVAVTSGHQDVALWAQFTAPATLTRQSIAWYQLEDAQGHPIAGIQFDVCIKTET